MLLRSSPPAKPFPPPPSHSLRTRERNANLPSFHLHLHNLNLSHTATTPRASSSGYRKVPLETPGAYRLIDEDTGESVILWGGIDEGDKSRFPSKEVLFSPAAAATSDLSTSSSAVTRERASAAAALGTFQKLKAHKVKALLVRRKKDKHPKSFDRGRFERSGVDVFESDSVFDEDNGIEDCNTEEDFVDQPQVRDKITPTSNFLKLLSEEEGLGKDRLPARETVSDSSKTPSPFSHPAGKMGWGVVDKTSMDRYERLGKRESRNGGSFFSKKSFKELGCSDYIIEALRKQQFLRPSHIQAMSYPHILEGKTCIVADQSGSGKTLAYLTPIIQCLRQEEIMGTTQSVPRNPRVVILAPTAELASQVLNNCRSMAKHGVPFRSIVATGGFRQKTQLDSLQQELDVLVATPGRFLYLVKEGFVELANLKSVVFDEVDILFSDEDFEQVLQNLITCAPVATQYLFVTATLPVNIYNKLVEVFPDSEVVMGPGMHRTSPGLEEILVDCSGDGEEKSPDIAFLNKKSALLKLAEESPVDKTIVFCNKIETCRKVENALKRYDRKEVQIKVLPFHSALAQEQRLSNLKEFLDSRTSDQLFLVCTDRASRGIDFKAVDHVVLFDFPRDPSEYVRRVGRAARGAGGRGTSFVFAVGKQVPLARRIIQRNQKGHPLHDIPC